MAEGLTLSEYVAVSDPNTGSVLRCDDTVKQLESSIFNHVSLGQWEAARASVGCLAADKNQSTRENAKELLKILIVESSSYWSESKSIPSPHHLSWLALNTFKEFFTEHKDKLPNYLQDLIEFRLLLFTATGVVSFSTRVATQLCQYHAVHVLKIPGAVTDTVPHFSGLIVSFIHDVLTSLSPALGHALITSLTVHNSSAHLANNESLQLIYIECINDCLEIMSRLKNVESVEPDSSYDSQYESDHPTSGVRSTRKECEKLSSTVYTLLSLLDPTQDMVKLTKKVDTVFHTLLRTTYVITPEFKVQFNTGRIYASLLGRSTPFLINRLHEVEEYLRMHPETEETTIGAPSADSPKKLSLQLAVPTSHSLRESKEEWRGRFYKALYDHKHFLESALEAGLQLVFTGQLPELSELMLREEYTPLRPIMLLMGWDKYPAAGSGKELLDVLWPVEVSMRQQLLFNGCCKLAFQVELVQWCLEKAKPHLQRSSPFTIHRAGEMFKGLETHSTLFVLHHYTPLASLEPVEVIDILKMRPRVPLISTATSLTPPPQFSRGTTPMKWFSESDSPPLLSPSIDLQKSFPSLKLKSLKPEQERDISVFRSFCAIRLILDAIWTSVQISNGAMATSKVEDSKESSKSSFDSQTSSTTQDAPVDHLEMRATSTKAARKLDFGLSSVPEDKSSEINVTSKSPSPDTITRLDSTHYSSGVIDKLQEAKMYISRIEPLNYRLEVLEDVFSLLFLTSADIKPVSVSESKENRVGTGVLGDSQLEGSLSTRRGSDVSFTFSSIALIRSKAGFLIDERIASDLLIMLQDCMNELRAAKFQQSQQTVSSHSEVRASSCTVKTSIPHTSLQQRSAKLEQYINEAKWRLQLVSSKVGILATLATSGKSTNLMKSDADSMSSSDESASEMSESETEEETKKERKKHKKPGIVLTETKEETNNAKQTSEFQNNSSSFNSHPPTVVYGRSSSPAFRVPSPSLSTSLPAPRPSVRGTRPHGSSPKPKKREQPLKPPDNLQQIEDDSGECADVEDRSPDTRPNKRRKRLRSRSSQVSLRKRRNRHSDQSEGSILRSSFVCQMLASPESLLRMCVKHANYSRAKEVVKIFKMKGDFGDFFVDFSQQYELISKGLVQKKRSSTPAKTTSFSAPVSGSASHSQTPPRSSLESAVTPSDLSQINLQMAIRTATTSSEALESLHRLLAPSKVSQMLFSGDKALEKAAEESVLLQTLSENVPTLVMLDIVCSSKLEPLISRRIVELASSRSQEVLHSLNSKWDVGKHSSRVSQTHDVVLSGPFVLLQMFSDVLGYFMNFGVVPTSPTLTTPTYSSPHTLLTTGGHQLRVDSIVNSKTFLDSYHDAREKIERELIQFSSEEKSELFEELSLSLSIEGSSSFSQRYQTKLSPVSIFDELIRALTSHAHTPVTTPGSTKERSLTRQSSYVQQLGEVGGGEVSTSFLWQFVRYVTKLLELLVRCLGLGGSSPTKSSLLLTILRESPSRVLGRLVFERGILPLKLESMMEDFSHLHIVEVLVKCCCPQLPSVAVKATRALPNNVSHVIALNESSETNAPEGVIPDPCSFSYKLINKLLNILKNSPLQSHSQDNIVTSEDLIVAYDNPEVKKLFTEARALASVDLRTLDTPTKQIVFYSNVVNFLYAHALILCVAMETSSEKGAGLEGVATLLTGSGVTLKTIKTSQIVQTTYFTKVGYFIGQLGLISCFDLHRMVLCRGLTPPIVVKGVELSARIKPSKPDPWAEHAPSSPDPCLVYAVHDGRLTSPIPVALTVENYTDSLKLAESWYLSTVAIDPIKKEVTVPEWLFDVRYDLIKTDPTLSSEPLNSDLSLLKYIHSKLEKERADVLQPLIEASEVLKSKKVSVCVRPDKTKLGYNFTLKRSTPSSPKTSPKGKRKRITRESSRKVISPPPVVVNEEPIVRSNYSFTPETLSFIKERAPLLAAVVHLLSPPCATVTSKTRKTGRTSSENDRKGSVDESMDTPAPATGRKGIFETLRSHVTKAPSPPPAPVKKASFDNKTTSQWQQTFDDVLSHFSTAHPMYQYLLSRLSCFNLLIGWDGPGSLSADSSKPQSSKEFQVGLRTLAALPSSSDQVGEACDYVMRRLLEEGRVVKAVKFLSSEPVSKHLHKISFLSDMVLSCAFVSNVSLSSGLTDGDEQTKMVVKNPLTLLSQISDPELASRLTLASLTKWPVGICVDTLNYCLHHLPQSSLLALTVKENLDCMNIYSLIMSNCESPLHTYKRHSTSSPWKHWSDLAVDSQTKSDYVLRLLLTLKAFDVVRQWAAVHKFGPEVTQQIEVEYLSHLLEGGTSDPIAAQQVLDGLSEDNTALNVCESLLEHADLQVTIFVLHYMLSRLSHCLHYAKSQDYCNKLLGAKALLCLPPLSRSQYKGLIMQPMLLVEQLLIDMKIDWASLVIKQLRTNEHISNIFKIDTPILDHTPLTFSEDEESHDPFLKTIMFYCSKSLEFPQPILVQNTPAQSLAPSLSTTRAPSPGPLGDTLKRSHLTTSMARPIPIDKQSSPYGGQGGMLDESYPSMTPRRPSISYKRRTTSITSPLPVERKEGSFKPPSEPPRREHWEKNSQARSCPVCKHVIFGMFSRRHHCRRCGRVVCSGCSSHVAEVKGYDIPVRVCDICHEANLSPDPQKTSEDVPSLPPFDIRALLPGNENSGAPSSPIRNYTLIPRDLMFNQNVRKEFYYERAPNTALFLSLVDLIVSKREAAGFILDCCHSVSAQLVPDSQGLINEEVDHHFVIGLIQNLLQNAKLRFAEAEDSSGVELCDTYLSRVDLLRLLVSSRCPKIPSIQELTKPDLARRVRDKLMQSDRFSLAMEVSTKCQLDTGAVLAAWGMACLKSGNSIGARNKFKNCFQVSSQSKLSSSGGHNLQLLQRIVEQIEQSPLVVTTRNAQFPDDWSSVVMGAMAIPERRSDECDLDTNRFNECVYYLRTYGPDSSLISFYVKHGCWMDACKAIKEQNCSTDLFIDHFWVPALKTGQIEYVEECLMKIDHTLSSWEAYLTAACRFFTQRGLFSVLYRTQLFMKDYIRAGMTCIKFFIGFSGRATSIADLYSRLHYLSIAKKHFQTYLEVKKRPAERRGVRSRYSRQYEETPQVLLPSVKAINQSELQQHMATIEMQTRVTHFLYQSAETMHTVTDPLPSLGGVADPTSPLGSSGGRHSSQQPATLFSNGHVRAEVAIQLLTCCQDIIEGYAFAREVIQVYRLPPGDIYCGTARVLALKQRYSDLRVLLQCLQKSQTKSHAAEALNDEIVMAAVKVLANQPKETKQIDKLVQLLASERSKIKAFVQCGKLKNAYLIAVKAGQVSDVRNISELAGKAGQIAVRDICEKWLQEHAQPKHR